MTDAEIEELVIANNAVNVEAPLTAEETWRRIESRREQMSASKNMKRGRGV